MCNTREEVQLTQKYRFSGKSFRTEQKKKNKLKTTAEQYVKMAFPIPVAHHFRYCNIMFHLQVTSCLLHFQFDFVPFFLLLLSSLPSCVSIICSAYLKWRALKIKQLIRQLNYFHFKFFFFCFPRVFFCLNYHFFVYHFKAYCYDAWNKLIFDDGKAHVYHRFVHQSIFEHSFHISLNISRIAFTAFLFTKNNIHSSRHSDQIPLFILLLCFFVGKWDSIGVNRMVGKV